MRLNFVGRVFSMHYDYRWWYAISMSVLLCVLSYYGLLAPEQEDLARLADVTLQSAVELQTLKEFAQQKNADINSVELAKAFAAPQANKIDFFARLSQLAHQQNVLIQSINMPVGMSQSSSEMQMQVLVEGELSALLHFALALMEQAQPIFIRDFSFHTTHTEALVLSVELLMMKNNLAMLTPPALPLHLSITRNPFCVPMNHALNMSNQDAATLALTPLTQLRLTGYLEIGMRKQALLSLPTGAVVAVEVGAVIGREKAVVRRIDQEALVAEEREGKRIRIAG